MSYSLDNFVRSTLSTAALATDTSLVLAAAAAPFRDPPAASAGAPGILILQDSATAPTAIEIVTYTGCTVSGGHATLTGVTRGVEGTTAAAWAVATPTFSGTTAAVLAALATTATLDAFEATLATVATSGSYTDLLDQPTLGTAAASATTDFAPAFSGATNLSVVATLPGTPDANTIYITTT